MVPSTVEFSVRTGDTLEEITFEVSDADDAEKDFTGATARLGLYYPNGTQVMERSLEVETSVPGLAVASFTLSPTETRALPTCRLRGEVEWTFPEQVAGEPLVLTAHKLSVRVTDDKLV